MKHLVSVEMLQCIKACTVNEAGDIFNGLRGNNRLDTGGSEFIIDPGLHDMADTGQNGIGTAIWLDVSGI